MPDFDLSSASVITDPPWDQARGIPGDDDPRGLFAAVAPHIARSRRAVIQLGCYTSPDFVAPLSERMPFLQVLWMEYSVPSYRGRILANADVAYAFGTHIPSRDGQRVIPSKTVSTGRRDDEGFKKGYGRNRSHNDVQSYLARADHPMPRHLNHLLWLVRWWSEPGETVIDPFMGSGTTAVAAHILGRKFIGIEIHKKYFDGACRRLEKVTRQLDMFHRQEPEAASQIDMFHRQKLENELVQS